MIMSMTRRWGTGEAGGGHIWAAWRVACWSGGWHHDAGSNLTCGLEVLIWTADKGDGVICRGDIEGLFRVWGKHPGLHADRRQAPTADSLLNALFIKVLLLD